jgi:hypothetical protein
MAQRSERGLPPAEVELVYQEVGGSHVFTAPGIGGFYYSSTSLETTFEEVAHALGLHVSRLYEVEAEYHLSMSLKEFRKHRKPQAEEDVSDVLLRNFVTAKMASSDHLTLR